MIGKNLAKISFGRDHVSCSSDLASGSMAPSSSTSSDFANSMQSLKDIVSKLYSSQLQASFLSYGQQLARVPHKSREKSSKSIKNFYQCIFISHGHEWKKQVHKMHLENAA